MIDLFEKNPAQVYDLKSLFQLFQLKTHPAKMLCTEILDALLADDFIKEKPRFNYRYNMSTQLLEGIFNRKANGKNTLSPKDGGEPILVAERNSLHAMDGDLVKACMMARRNNHVREAVVTEILERADHVFVGTLQVQPNYAYLLTEDRTLANDIFIPTRNLKKGKTGIKLSYGLWNGLKMPRIQWAKW